MIKNLTPSTWIEYDTVDLDIIDFDTLWNMKPEEPDTIKMFGRNIPIPRLQQVFGIDYIFSGKSHRSIPIPAKFNIVIDHFNKKYNRNFNMLVVNWYRDGSDYISMHADDEKQIVKNSEIITLSLGDTRTFVLVNKQTKERFKFDMSNKQYITMGGLCQSEFKHGITKTKKNVGPRISITLREFS
jgi:alkylated DNA repair dioxygenase AlkB